ncbi:MAG: MinD/ParA family protein [Planctomycetes bacterium]|nr:MinD/ParA family protein [Planctomycetota bacterium]
MDQAQRLRAMVSGSERRARFLAVASGKGGVGKTNLAVNLGLAIAAQGKRVIVVDADIGLANADVLLGVQPRWNLGHVLSGEVTALEALTPAPGGLFLLAGASGSRHLSDLEPAERDYLVRSLQELEAYAEVVFFDAAAGISRNVIGLALACDEVLVVTAPEPTAIADGYAVVKALSREKGAGRIRLVVNMAAGAAEAERVSGRIQAVARKFLGIEVGSLGFVPLDDHVRQAVRRKKPFLLEFPEAPAADGVRSLAESLIGEEPASRTPGPGFVKRFASALHGALG